ncbi:MAG TPA: hypothetical protein PLM53_04435 [Spirochaetota bacterium]|nr:hypothetical protein [Spirochaetota bacterium]HPC42773.1 hypothetical protein [Spirochaetota bacterium]HPL18482.1 hypothetical protein [Spirochaetota bacterium]HQF07592.1 hypothetical protein [Spirochaetota bacterium]HQH96323.1 hypothetical protein [Spirochaetota bacterium]
MDFTSDQVSKINIIIEKLSAGNPDVKNSPSTRVMAINLLNAYGWDTDKTLNSLK